MEMIKQDDIVELPTYMQPSTARVGRQSRIGKVLTVFDTNGAYNPLAPVECVLIQMVTGFRHSRTLGKPFILPISEVTPRRMHMNCETCTCREPEPTKAFDEELEDDDEDEDEDERR